MEPLDPEVASTNGHGPPIDLEAKLFATIAGGPITGSNHARSIIESVMRMCSTNMNGGTEEAPISDYTALENIEMLVELRKIKEVCPEQYYGYFQPFVTNRLRIFWPPLDARISKALLPSEIPVTLPYLPDTLMPQLPASAYLDPVLGLGASPWLDAYIAYSRKWSPRGAENFHEAIGLWMLSTIAARRIYVNLVSQRFPMLFIGLVAESTMYAKTETVKLGLNGLIRAGCRSFLAPDRVTPQAMVRAMSGRVPKEYGSLDPLEQEVVRKQLAFAGQKGWFYEEWGGMLSAMARRDGPMAEFHSLLRHLYDGHDSYASDTISRGLEKVDSPYLSILGNATPPDLQQYLKPGSHYWNDGFWPRFALIVPGPHETPSMDVTDFGVSEFPIPLQIQLHNWHLYLGIKESVLTPVVDARARPTGEWRSNPPPLTQTEMKPEPDVQVAFRAYDTAMRKMSVIDNVVDRDLRASYGRFADKALRVAMLLASLEASINYNDAIDQGLPATRDITIYLRHWVRGQEVAERWRAMLHQTVELIAGSVPRTRDELLEDKIEGIIMRTGPNSPSECKRHIRGYSTPEIKKALEAMAAGGRLAAIEIGKTMRYDFPHNVAQEEPEQEAEPDLEGEQEDVPF